MEYQKIANLFDDAPNQPSRFITKNWIKKMMNLEEHTMLVVKSNLKLLC